MGEDRTRTRFVDSTGGLNSNTQPWKIADNEYAAANNMLLDGDDLVSRDGSTLILGVDNAARVTTELHKSIAEYTFYDKLGALTLCVVTASAGVTGNTTFHVYTRTSGSNTFTSAGSITTTSAGVVATGIQKRDLLNFKNRMIVADGTNRPLEYNRNYSNTAMTLLGIDGPHRKKYLCDFYTTSPAVDDPFYLNAPYTLLSDDGALVTENAYIAYLNTLALQTNNYCLKLKPTVLTAGTEVKQRIVFTTPVDLTAFLDTTPSDANDYIVFTAFFNNMLSMDYLSVDICMNAGYSAGTFTDGSGWHKEIQLTQAILNANDWGGAPGNNNGRYFIKLTKQAFLDSNDAEDVAAASSFWASIKAINFTLKTAAVKVTVAPAVYIDLVGMEESPPIVAPSEKLIRSFDPYEAWNGGTGYDYNKKTEGFSSYEVDVHNTGGGFAWTYLTQAAMTAKDLGHWAGDEKISRSDFVAIDVYNDSTVIAGLWLTLRFYDASHWVGLTKTIFEGAPVGARLPILGMCKPQTWTTIYMPIKFMMQTFWTNLKEIVGEYENDNHPGWGGTTKDTWIRGRSIGGGTDAEIQTAENTAWDDLVTIMSAVVQVQIGVKAITTGSNKLRFDNLRLCKQHLEKGICSFNAFDISRYIDVPGIVEKVTNKYPLIGATLDASTKIFGNLIHKALMVGEDWQVDGVQNEDDLFDYEIKTSLISCLKMEIKGGDTATATHAFSPTMNLNNFGLDVNDTNKALFGISHTFNTTKFTRFLKLITGDTYYFSDGYDSDENDYIMFDVMCDHLSSLDFGYIAFFPSSTNTGDFYAYDLVTSDLNTLVGLSKARNGKWMTCRVRKCDFKRYGSTAGINWGSITSVMIVIGTKGSEKTTVRIDNMNLKACGALKGDYYYKVLYRSDDSISSPSEASLVLPAANVDAYLGSIPVPSDGRVIYKDIYRIGGDNDQYKLVDTIGSSVTDYVDKKMDNQLGAVLVDDNSEPPVAGCMWQHRNRLWFGNTKSHTSRVLWSKSFNPCSFPIANYMDINPNIYGSVVGGCSRGDDQIVFKTRSVSKIVESGDRYWDVLIDDSIGCTAKDSICSENNIVYWIYNKKAYRMDGDRVDRVFGHKVQNLFKYADSTAKAICHNGRILFAVKSASGSTANDVIISFNTVYGKWESVLIGEGYDVADMFSSVIDSKLFASKSALVRTGTNPNYVYYGYLYELFTGTTDNGTAIAAMVTPKYIPGYEKRIEGFKVFLTSVKTGANDVVMQPIIDYLKTNTVSDTIPLIDSVSPQIVEIEIRGSDVTNFLGCEFSCATTTGVWRYLMSVFEYIVETDM